MVDVTIKYKDSTIAELNATGKKTINTSGKYCEGNIEVNYTPNSRSYEITLAKSSGWVLLTALDADVLAHINDDTFSAKLYLVSDWTFEQWALTTITAGNAPLAYTGSYPVYGATVEASSATASKTGYVYYPANYTQTSVGLGGSGAFRVADGKLYVRHYDAYMHSGTFRLTLTW